MDRGRAGGDASRLLTAQLRGLWRVWARRRMDDRQPQLTTIHLAHMRSRKGPRQRSLGLVVAGQPSCEQHSGAESNEQRER